MSTEKGKKKSFQLQYPLPAEVNSANERKSNPAANQHRIGNTDIYELTGSKAGTGLRFCSSTNHGLHVRLSINDEKELVYEVQVPFSLFYKDVLSPVDSGKPVYCELVIAGFEKNSVSYTNLFRRYTMARPATVAYNEREDFVGNTRIKMAVPLAIR